MKQSRKLLQLSVSGEADQQTEWWDPREQGQIADGVFQQSAQVCACLCVYVRVCVLLCVRACVSLCYCAHASSV